ncbi:2-oxo-4-hydroxy-4-carboxy-5-ureidoimidazoline decarboxylase [Streptomyces sp. NPDC020422]|uniref:2-oxo-4-hydroxy-4-carboxy-5-ureidoimidazoline decarboxylase n=1 Tax=Streptomyces sp. NPDC020422 TaxID=3365074 RepID=UPI0037900337
MKFAHPSDTSPFPPIAWRHIHPTASLPPPPTPSLPESPLTSTSDTHAPSRTLGSPAIPAQAARHWHPDGLPGFNAAPHALAESLLLRCCGSRRWAERVAAHRPYPTLDALLAAADEAGYDLSGADLDEALSHETPALPPPDAPPAARTALQAAHAAYESGFGHAFVISLDGVPAGERLDRVLAGIRSRLGNEREEERAVAAEELRRLARTRLTRSVASW